MASDDSIITQGLTCPLCFELLKEPKLLICTHTFCQDCLVDVYQSQTEVNILFCPICRQITQLDNIDVSDLPTNIPIKSMVEDVKSSKINCTVCDPKENEAAVSYCQSCGEHMCDSCLDAHGKWKKYRQHEVVGINEVRSRKVRPKEMCKVHHQEEVELFCVSCKTSICFRCRVLDHNSPDHDVERVADFKKELQHQYQSLQADAQKKMTSIKEHLRLVNKAQEKFDTAVNKVKMEISVVHDKSVSELHTARDKLLRRCNQHKQTFDATLGGLRETDSQLISRIGSATQLVGNGLKTLPDGQTLAVHYRLCSNLQELLDRQDPDESQVNRVTRLVEDLHFIPWDKDELILGEVVEMGGDEHAVKDARTSENGSPFQQNLGVNWTLKKTGEILHAPASGGGCAQSVSDLSPTRNGFMAVAYEREIMLYSIEGKCQTAVKNVYKVTAMAVLSNGDYVVRNSDNTISIYDSQDLSNDVKLQTLVLSGSQGGITVDKKDNIFVGYSSHAEVHVFRRSGGPPIREIECNISPDHIWAMHYHDAFVIRVQDSVGLIEDGSCVKRITEDYRYSRLFPFVLRDDSIVVGMKKGRFLTISLYTDQLEYVKTILHSFDTCYDYMNCFLSEFSTGHFAFSTGKGIFIFERAMDENVDV